MPTSNPSLTTPSIRNLFIAPLAVGYKPERCSWIWERDRPGRSGRRLAGQFSRSLAITVW
jgi:hypothetical protein